MQRGGGSKDTWVLSSGPVDTFGLLAPPGQPVELKRSANDLPSRVADNVFWLGRYAERAEDTARLVRTILARLTIAWVRLSRCELQTSRGISPKDSSKNCF
jgi:hypothetical protein